MLTINALYAKLHQQAVVFDRKPEEIFNFLLYAVKNEREMKDICQRIRKLRLAKEYDIPTLAGEAGVSKGTISRIERMDINFSMDVLISVARGLEVSLEELFSGITIHPVPEKPVPEK